MLITLTDINNTNGNYSDFHIHNRVSYIKRKIISCQKSLLSINFKWVLVSIKTTIYSVQLTHGKYSNKIILSKESMITEKYIENIRYEFNNDNYGIRQLLIKIYKEFGWIK